MALYCTYVCFNFRVQLCSCLDEHEEIHCYLHNELLYHEYVQIVITKVCVHAVCVLHIYNKEFHCVCMYVMYVCKMMINEECMHVYIDVYR